jgi:hypothetical protein
MKTAVASKTLVTFYLTTWRHIQEDSKRQDQFRYLKVNLETSYEFSSH